MEIEPSGIINASLLVAQHTVVRVVKYINLSGKGLPNVGCFKFVTENPPYNIPLVETTNAARQC
jgi:hypothetical protein